MNPGGASSSVADRWHSVFVPRTRHVSHFRPEDTPNATHLSLTRLDRAPMRGTGPDAHAVGEAHGLRKRHQGPAAVDRNRARRPATRRSVSRPARHGPRDSTRGGRGRLCGDPGRTRRRGRGRLPRSVSTPWGDPHRAQRPESHLRRCLHGGRASPAHSSGYRRPTRHLQPTGSPAPATGRWSARIRLDHRVCSQLQPG